MSILDWNRRKNILLSLFSTQEKTENHLFLKKKRFIKNTIYHSQYIQIKNMNMDTIWASYLMKRNL